MTGRSLASMVLAAMGCGLPSFCAAQSYSPAGQVVTLPPEAGGYGGAYALPSFGDSSYGGAVPAGGYAGAACPPQGLECPPPPQHDWLSKCKPLFIHPKLLEPPRGSYVRVDYLLWEIEKPGDVTLGAPVIPDKGTPLVEAFPAGDNTTTNGFATDAGFGYSPRLDELQLRDIDGARFTFGVPFKNYVTFEGSFFVLGQGSDHFEWGPRDLNRRDLLLPLAEFNPTTTVKENGVTPNEAVPGNPVRLYDRFEVDYESDMWGSEAKFVVDALAPQGEGLKFRPLFGFKHVSLQEAMHQKGQFDGTFPFATTIDSDTDNTILGGTVGLRTELVHRWFVLGVEPAVTFAGNIAQAKVVTERFSGPFDPRTEHNSDFFDFSPILDLKTYAKIRVTDHMSVNVGYDAFWLSRVYRPARVIEYNIDTQSDPGNIVTDFDTKREDDHVAVEGLSVGVEFVY